MNTTAKTDAENRLAMFERLLATCGDGEAERRAFFEAELEMASAAVAAIKAA